MLGIWLNNVGYLASTRWVFGIDNALEALSIERFRDPTIYQLIKQFLSNKAFLMKSGCFLVKKRQNGSGFVEKCERKSSERRKIDPRNVGFLAQ